MTIAAGINGGSGRPVADTEREVSCTSSLENIEALMNRYRKDEQGACTTKRSDKDAMHHAVSILRAAGVEVHGGPCVPASMSDQLSVQYLFHLGNISGSYAGGQKP